MRENLTLDICHPHTTIEGMETIDTFEGEHRFLSNFYPVPIVFENKIYPSSEHLFQAVKTDNPAERELVRREKTPGKAKKAGKLLTMRPDWDDVRFDIMGAILCLKFAQNLDLSAKLLATGNAELIEGNWWGDTYWGVCENIGQNSLGILLEITRMFVKNGRIDMAAHAEKIMRRNKVMAPTKS